MKLLNGKKLAHSLILIPVLFILTILFFIYACGGGGGSGSSGTGSTSIAFNLGLQGFGSSRAASDAGFECVTEAHEIDVIEAEVRDEHDELLDGPVQFPCQDHQGTLTGVEPGDYRVVNVFARDSSGFIIYSGKSAPGPVIAGQTNDFGTIILSPYGTAIVEGIVKDAVTSSPLENVTIDMLRGGDLEVTGLSDSFGFYSLDVPPASGYTGEFSKAGFLTETYHNVSAVADTVTTLETVRLISEAHSGPGEVSGTIVNAMDGTGVSGLTVALREGINAKSGPIVDTTTTESDGFYSFADLDGGNYTAEAGGSGFITTFFSVISIGGTTTPDQDASITPVLFPGETRIILTWGETPEDLDSHLTGPLPDGSRFHVYFANMVEGGAILDLDDTDSFGPETTTIQEQIPGVYRFSVHDYTNRFLTDADDSFALADSGAQVRVFRVSGLLATFNVPVSQEGTLWTVFELSGDTITPINFMSYEQNPDSIP